MVAICAIVRAKFITNWRYKVNFWLEALYAIIFLIPAATLLLNGSAGGALFNFTSAIDYSFYLLVATTFWEFAESLWSFVFEIRRQMREGIFDEQQLLPLSLNQKIIAWSIEGLVNSVVSILPLSLVALGYSVVRVSVLNSLACLGLAVVAMFSCYCLAIVLMGIAMLWRESDQLVSFLGNIAPFIGGVYIPLVNMPECLRFLGFWMPHTWGLDLVRSLLFGYPCLYGFWNEIGILAAQMVVYYLVCRVVYNKLYNMSRVRGGIVGY